MKARTDTRRLYRFEEMFLLKRRDKGNKDTPVTKLRRLAERVWRDYSKCKLPCPEVISGGQLYDGVCYSFYELPPVRRIELARSQQRPLVLLHEMVHALGHGPHNETFVALYFELLHRYLGYDPHELELQASWFKIKPKV